MDNLTHAIVGVLLAENALAFAPRRNAPSPRFRAEIYAVSVIGNNLPDLDVVYASHFGPPPFGYLLQHRGFTHTVVAALGFALVMSAVVMLLRHRSGSPFDRTEARTFAFVTLLAPLMHLVMDFTNNYGIHPFWPVDNRWFYGDTFFIVEPALWTAVVAPLVFSMRSRVGRGTFILVLTTSLALAFFLPWIPLREAALLAAITVALTFAGRTLTERTRVLVADAGVTVVLLAFLLGSLGSKALSKRAVASALPRATVLDVVATPMPANPFCWTTIWIGLDGDDYVMRLGRVALVPSWLDLDECPFNDKARPSAATTSLPLGTDPKVAILSEIRFPRADLGELAAKRCEMAALLRFARAPYIGRVSRDGSRIVGDERFDRSPGLDFTDVMLREGSTACPNVVPPWTPPRADALTP